LAETRCVGNEEQWTERRIKLGEICKTHFGSFAGNGRFRWSGGGHIKEINRLVGGEH
jgi:hypothetical protein